MAKKYNCEKNGKQYFRIKRIINGKEKEFYGEGEKDAIRKYEAYMAKVSQGIDVDSTRIKFKDGMLHWMYNVKRIESTKKSSYARYECIYRLRFTDTPIDNIPVGNVRRVHAEKFVSQLVDEGCSPGQINDAVKVAKMYFEYLLEQEVIGRNPFRKLKTPKSEEPPEIIEVFTEQETKAMIRESHNTINGFLIELALATGMREVELLALDYADFRDDGVYVSKTYNIVTSIDKAANRTSEYAITRPKSDSGVRFIPLTDEMQEALKSHRTAQIQRIGMLSPHVFTSATGKRLNKNNVRRMYLRLLNRSGIAERKFHTMRHTFITNCVKAGIDFETIKELAGHSDIKQTQGYTHIGTSHKRAAIIKLFSKEIQKKTSSE